MFSKDLFYVLKLIVVLFPLGAGLVLAFLGVDRLDEANVRPVFEPPPPYGVLIFSSEECRVGSTSMYLTEVLLEEDLVRAAFIVGQVVLGLDSPREETFGFQVPYSAGVLEEVHVSGLRAGGGEAVDVEVLDKDVVVVGDHTSLVYVRFLAVPELGEYMVKVGFVLRGAVVKRSFSTYEIVIPFSKTTHMADGGLRGVYPVDFGYLSLNLRVPGDVEVREAVPAVAGEMIETSLDAEGFGADRHLSWVVPTEPLLFGKDSPMSEVVRVRLEVPEESEERGRLMFDSGLFMGLGVSLIFGGVHEMLRFAAELKKKGPG